MRCCVVMRGVGGFACSEAMVHVHGMSPIHRRPTCSSHLLVRMPDRFSSMGHQQHATLHIWARGKAHILCMVVRVAWHGL
jgi:hypothetical protein